MKVIDLLKKIAKEEEVPKKIKYRSYIMIYDIDENDYRTPEQDYYDTDVKTYKWFTDCIDIFASLNDEIEIIEEKTKKITTINLCKQEDAYFIDTLNDTIKAVNYLLEKESDK